MSQTNSVCVCFCYSRQGRHVTITYCWSFLIKLICSSQPISFQEDQIKKVLSAIFIDRSVSNFVPKV